MIADKIVTLTDDRKLAFNEYGDPNGKPVFYFHGWPSSRLSGKETDEAAKKLGVRVIAPDRPGYGLSDFIKDRKLLDWPDDVLALADHLKIQKFAIMGVSGGGPYAAVCAYKIPERVTKAAIVVGLAPIANWQVMKGMYLQSKIGWKYYHKIPFIAYASSFLLRIIAYSPIFIGLSAKEDTINDSQKSRMKASFKEAFKQGFKGSARDLILCSGNWDFPLEDIQTKVFLWYGEKDKNVSVEMGKYYKRVIKNSDLYIDPEGGHLFRWNREEDILRKLVGKE